MVEIIHILRIVAGIVGGCLSAYGTLCSVYLFTIVFIGFCARRKRAVVGDKLSNISFAVLIPAHDEELLIAQTVHSVNAIDYPKDKFSVFVVADNCADKTALHASEAGATVIERTDPVNRGKGHALVTGLKRVFDLQPSVDAIVVVDADTQVDPEFLSAMSQSIVAGECAIQGVYLGSNQHDSWRTELLQLAWSLFNFLRPLGRTTLGFSASLLGNGMCFRADLLKSRNWSAFSITEDIEYGIQLLLAGKRVAFNQDARVFGQMAKTADQAESQRLRWEKGRLAILKEFATPLIKRSIGQFDPGAAEMLLDMITPPLALLVSLNIVGSLLILFVSTKLFLFSLIPSDLLILYVFLGFLTVGPSRGLVKSLIYAPFYILWKFALYGAQLIRPNRKMEWVRTSRHN